MAGSNSNGLILYKMKSIIKKIFTPAAEGHGLCPWMNAPAFGRLVPCIGRGMSPQSGVKKGDTGYARGAPRGSFGKKMVQPLLIP